MNMQITDVDPCIMPSCDEVITQFWSHIFPRAFANGMRLSPAVRLQHTRKNGLLVAFDFVNDDSKNYAAIVFSYNGLLSPKGRISLVYNDLAPLYELSEARIAYRVIRDYYSRFLLR